jgi:hypothetical protein
MIKGPVKYPYLLLQLYCYLSDVMVARKIKTKSLFILAKVPATALGAMAEQGNKKGACAPFIMEGLG